MTTNGSHAPSFKLTRLYRKQSQKGSTYFTGRMGGAKVTLLKSRDTADDGGEIWDLLIAEAPQKPASAREPAEPPNTPAGAKTRVRSHARRQRSGIGRHRPGRMTSYPSEARP